MEEVSRYLAWLSSFPEGTMLIFLVVMIIVAFAWWKLEDLRCWLKGSRTTYYLSESGFVKSSTKKLRTPAGRVGIDMNFSNQGVIEISRGGFRPSSAIYGDYHLGPWGIAKVSMGCNSQGGFGADWVDLRDRASLPVEMALRLINTYPSLQVMLHRIAELESQLKESDRQRKKRWAGIKTVLTLINVDRNKYRSKTSEQIRKWLEILDRPEEHSKEVEPSDIYIENWMLKISSEMPADKA